MDCGVLKKGGRAVVVKRERERKRERWGREMGTGRERRLVEIGR